MECIKARLYALKLLHLRFFEDSKFSMHANKEKDEKKNIHWNVSYHER